MPSTNLFSRSFLKYSFAFLLASQFIGAASRVRDVNLSRNQVTVLMQKAGEFGMGKKVYFFRGGKSTGTGEIKQAFHTKAIIRILSGSPQVGDDATLSAKAPKKARGKKENRVSFAAATVEAQEFLVELQFEGQEKFDRKLTLNAAVAAQIKGGTGFIALDAALIRDFKIEWRENALHVLQVRLKDGSAFDVEKIVARDVYAKFKPSAETRSQSVVGTITFKKKLRDLKNLYDGINLVLHIAPQNERLESGKLYKLKAYCNELFAAETTLRKGDKEVVQTLLLNPIDLAPDSNLFELRMVEVDEKPDFLLETDNNQLVGMLEGEKLLNEKKPVLTVKFLHGQGITFFFEK